MSQNMISSVIISSENFPYIGEEWTGLINQDANLIGILALPQPYFHIAVLLGYSPKENIILLYGLNLFFN